MLRVALASGLMPTGWVLWALGDRNHDGRTELGASILGGAVVAFSVVIIEVFAARRADRRELFLMLNFQQDHPGIDLHGWNLADFRLRRKQMPFADLRGANLKRACLVDTNLMYAKLGRANLREADLTNADLRSADLAEADLRGANLTDALLGSAGAVWPSTNFTGVRRDDKTRGLPSAPSEPSAT